MPGTVPEEKEEFTNLVNNAVTPVDVRKFKQVLGSAEYVAAEVLVSYLARYIFKVEKRTVMELAAIHAVSIPMIGGFSAGVEENHALGYEAPFNDQLYDGAKGIPAVFAAQYICNTALAGLHAPKLNFKDILVTAAAKMVTRPLLGFLYPMLGNEFRNNLDVLEILFTKQRVKGRLYDDGLPASRDLR